MQISKRIGQRYQKNDRVLKKTISKSRSLPPRIGTVLEVISETNKNDIQEVLGPPSSKSVFDNDLWIYIEREITNDKLLKLGGCFLDLDGRNFLASPVYDSMILCVFIL